MDAQQISRGSRVPPRAKAVVTIAAAAAAALLAGVVVVVNLPAQAGHASPAAALALAASGRAAVNPSPRGDASVPSAQAVFEMKARILSEELPPTF